MSLLAALPLLLGAAAPVRVESLNLYQVGARPALRLGCSATPRLVSVHREGDTARVTLAGTDLGSGFSGGTRFAWRPASMPASLAEFTSTYPLDVLQIDKRAGDVELVLRVPPETSIDVRRDGEYLTIVFPESPVLAATRMAQATPGRSLLPQRLTTPPAVAPPVVVVAEPRPVAPPAPPPPPPLPVVEAAPAPAPLPLPPPAPIVVETKPEPMLEPAPLPPPPVARTETAATPPPAPDAAALARGLFPGAAAQPEQAAAAPAEADRYTSLFPAATPGEAEQAKPGEAEQQAEWRPTQEFVQLYGQLFPQAGAAQAAPAPRAEEKEADFGAFRIEPGLTLGFVSGDAFAFAAPVPTEDEYFQIQPKLNARLSLFDGRFTAGYEPIFRGFGASEVVNSDTHRANAALELAFSPRFSLRLSDYFVTGQLESYEVDPGREYFFDLRPFDRNQAEAEARIEFGPRFDLTLGGGLTTVRFEEQGGFFDYDQRRARAELGFETTPLLRTALVYEFDQVPAPAQRPEAESRAHTLGFKLAGDIMPLLTGELTVGYRDQENPNAAEGGRSFGGLTVSGALTRYFSRSALFTLWLGRSTPLSAFEQNAFYLSNSVQGSLAFPLPLELQLNAGAGYVLNDYRTDAAGIGEPREDRIFGWSLGLRRSIGEKVTLLASYRKERRRSNLDRFETDTEGLMLQLDFRFARSVGSGR